MKLYQAYIIKHGIKYKLKGFRVTECGKIWREPFVDSIGRSYKGSFKKPCRDKDGYLFVNIPIEGKCSPIKIHRIVASTFIDTEDLYMEVNHIDGNKENNHKVNLEWLDHTSNMKHAHITKLIDKRNFSDAEVSLMRKYYEDRKFSAKEISHLFNAPLGTIWGILLKYQYKDVI